MPNQKLDITVTNPICKEIQSIQLFYVTKQFRLHQMMKDILSFVQILYDAKSH